MSKGAKFFVLAILCLLSGIYLIPFLWTVSTALKEGDKIFVFPPQWIPDPVKWDNFPTAWTVLPFTKWVGNTALITIICTFGSLLSSALVAYGFARFQFKGKNVLFAMMLGTMMLPGQVTMIPVFMIWRELGAIDTFAPLTVPSFFAGAFSVFLMRQFMMSIPRDFDEAAMLDGAGYLRIWWSVLLPNCKPVLATIGVLGFIGHWEDFNGPLIYLNSPEKYTVSLGLRMFQDSYGSDTQLVMAASLIHILPTIVLFFAAQRYFIQGLHVSGFGGR